MSRATSCRQVRGFFGSTLAAAQVGMYGDTRPGPSPSELSAFYDLVQHYLKSLAANLPPGDVVHSSHHSLQVGLSAVLVGLVGPAAQLRTSSLTQPEPAMFGPKEHTTAALSLAAAATDSSMLHSHCSGLKSDRSVLICLCRLWVGWWCSATRTRRC